MSSASTPTKTAKRGRKRAFPELLANCQESAKRTFLEGKPSAEWVDGVAAPACEEGDMVLAAIDDTGADGDNAVGMTTKPPDGRADDDAGAEAETPVKGVDDSGAGSEAAHVV